jgi:RimJ/RimL family protein N-acetyltransferase
MQPPAWAPTLSGHGITLRAHRPDDEDEVLEQCRDTEMQRWTLIPVPYERRHAKEFLASRARRWADRVEYSFAIEAEGRFAGSLDLRPQGGAGLVVGYALAPWARGKGYCAAALRAGLAWGFDTLEPEVAIWSAIAGNWASRRVAWSVGFRVEGTVRGLEEQRGIRLDGWIGSLRRGDPLSPIQPWYDPPVLSGERIRLRPHQAEDISSMTQACNDAVTQQWLAQLPRPYTRDDARAHLEEIAEEEAAGRAVFWAVVDRRDRLIGEIGMWGLARGESRSAEVGYWAHPAGRGTGLTTEAVRLAARYGVLSRTEGGLGLRRLVIRAAEGNLASQRVAEGAGFRRTGVDRQAETLRDGRVQDLVRFDLVAGEAGE